MIRSNILKIHNDLKNGLISFEDLIKQRYLFFDKYKSCNSVITNLKQEVIKDIIKFDKKNLDDENLLYGIPYSLKDNVCTKNILTTAGSKFLKNFIPSYSATVYEILQKKEAILLSKDAMDEYGLGTEQLLQLVGPSTHTGGFRPLSAALRLWPTSASCSYPRQRQSLRGYGWTRCPQWEHR